MRLHPLPQVGRSELPFRQKPLNPVVADLISPQLGHPRSGGLSKGADQIIAVQIEQFFIVHADSLAHAETKTNINNPNEVLNPELAANHLTFNSFLHQSAA
jgi:hypothetical protein